MPRKFATPEEEKAWKEHVKEYNRQYKQRPEYQEYIKNFKGSEEYKRRQREYQSERWRSDEFKGIRESKEFKKKQSEYQSKFKKKRAALLASMSDFQRRMFLMDEKKRKQAKKQAKKDIEREQKKIERKKLKEQKDLLKQQQRAEKVNARIIAAQSDKIHRQTVDKAIKKVLEMSQRWREKRRIELIPRRQRYAMMIEDYYAFKKEGEALERRVLSTAA